MQTKGASRRLSSGSSPTACVMGDIDLVRTLAMAGISSVAVVEPGNPARY